MTSKITLKMSLKNFNLIIIRLLLDNDFLIMKFKLIINCVVLITCSMHVWNNIFFCSTELKLFKILGNFVTYKLYNPCIIWWEQEHVWIRIKNAMYFKQDKHKNKYNMCTIQCRIKCKTSPDVDTTSDFERNWKNFSSIWRVWANALNVLP